MKSHKIRVAGKLLGFSEAELEPGWTVAVRPGGWLLIETPGGERVRLMKMMVKNRFFASVGGKLVSGEIQREAVRGTHATSAGDADLIAQFPGKVRKVLVAPSQAVEVGDSLLLVEAMKMEFTIKAPFSGVVSRICVSEGQQLTPGDRLVDLIEAQGADHGT